MEVNVVVEYHCILKQLRASKCLFQGYLFRNTYVPPYMFIFHVIPYMFTTHVLPSQIDLYAENMMLGGYVLTHISLLYASMVAHILWVF